MNKKILKVGFRYLIIVLILCGIAIASFIVLNNTIKKEKEEIKQEEPIVEQPKQEEIKKEETPKKETKKKVTKKKKTTTTVKKSTTTVQKSQTAGTYKITHYGWDCCKSGVTATGYNVKNTIYYNDKQYGKVRIVAMSKAMPLYSIIKIKNYKFGGDIIAIVIDRGVGNGVIDLLVENERTASKYGIQRNVSIEVLRKGK